MLNSSYQPSYQPFDTYQYQPQPILQLPKPSIESAPVVSSQLSAFRLGGPVDLFSRNYIGYLLNWVLIGFFNGAIPALVYSLFGVYLHLQAYQGNAAVALLEFAWNFKFIFSFLTDGAPINRYRRKPYMFIGWGILTVLLLVFAFRPQMEPYKRYGVIVNRDAESKGPHYVIPLIITSLARIMVITACEGMMFEVAHREWELERGRTQSISMMARGVGQVLGIILVAFGSFGPDFGGTYTHSLSLRAMFSIWTLVALTGMVVTKFLLSEEPIASSAQPFASQMHRIWRIVQHRTTWQIMLFGLFQNAVMTLKYHEKDAFYRIRLGATPLSLNMSDAVGTVGSVAAACLLIQFWLNTNWRKLMLWSLMAVAFTRELVIIEIAAPGHLAATFGIITTVHYLGKPFATRLNVLLSTNHVDVEQDTNEEGLEIATEMWIIFTIRIVVLLAIVRLLPRQKRHALERKLRSDPNLVIPLVMFICVVLVFGTVVTSSVLAIIPSTSCLTFAGGDGCV
ncbi:hypothetical protein Poli38472_008080 [Pythium oligandrum]|uniref:Uncharacterized protein n=1 Tax=Pythium oligandrum TaxID=41045 RepID=A0A8K1CND0_PYTOL|nr:hypothetical protein Poli38472_008080 [Pythium oligandrum]|eukprot:TMW65438.1 hypothetical protein Poli38472_008080 [Pythium oligandrum]